MIVNSDERNQKHHESVLKWSKSHGSTTIEGATFTYGVEGNLPSHMNWKETKRQKIKIEYTKVHCHRKENSREFSSDGMKRRLLLCFHGGLEGGRERGRGVEREREREKWYLLTP